MQRCIARRARSISARSRGLDFGEHGLEGDDSSGGDVVADSGWLSIEVEPQLAEFSVELAGKWFAQVYALVAEEVDVAFGLTELVVGEGVEPVGNLGFQLYRVSCAFGCWCTGCRALGFPMVCPWCFRRFRDD